MCIFNKTESYFHSSQVILFHEYNFHKQQYFQYNYLPVPSLVFASEVNFNQYLWLEKEK